MTPYLHQGQLSVIARSYPILITLANSYSNTVGIKNDLSYILYPTVKRHMVITRGIVLKEYLVG